MAPKRKVVRPAPQVAAEPLPASASEILDPTSMPEFTAAIEALEQSLPTGCVHAVVVPDLPAFVEQLMPVATAFPCAPAPETASKDVVLSLSVAELYVRDRACGVLPRWSCIEPALLSPEMNIFCAATKKYAAPHWMSAENLALFDSGLEAADLKAKNNVGTLAALLRDNYARNLHIAVTREAWEDPWVNKREKWSLGRSALVRPFNDQLKKTNGDGEMWSRFKAIQSFGLNVLNVAYIEYQTSSYGRPPSGNPLPSYPSAHILYPLNCMCVFIQSQVRLHRIV